MVHITIRHTLFHINSYANKSYLIDVHPHPETLLAFPSSKSWKYTARNPYYYQFTTRRDGRLSWHGWLTHSGHFTPELDMDWIHLWIGLDWIGSEFSGNFMNWIGSYNCDPLFFPFIKFNNRQTLTLNTILCIFEDFNRL